MNCRACGKLMGIADECPYCGRARNSPVGYVTSLMAWSSGPNGFSVTRALIGFCLFIFAVGLGLTFYFGGSEAMVKAIFSPSSFILQALGANSPMVFEGTWWTAFTSVFLHIGLIHLGFNMYALSIVGPIMENSLGRSAFFVLFVASGAIGALLSASNGAYAAGASGAIMGLVGGGIAISLLAGRRMDDPLLKTFVTWAGLTFLFGLFSGLNIDNWGHFGGFASGAAISFVWYKLGRDGQKVFGPLGILSLVVLIFAYASHLHWLL